jgi:hypothetical protein
MPTCDPPPLEADSGLRWRLLATIDPADEEEENQQSWLPLDLSPDYSPPTIGYLEQGFVEIEHLYSFEFTTTLGALTVELKEQFVPTRISWKHFTQDKTTLVTTSTDETIVLTVDDPNRTWPLEIPTVAGTTDGQWDGDFVIHETV